MVTLVSVLRHATGHHLCRSGTMTLRPERGPDPSGGGGRGLQTLHRPESDAGGGPDPPTLHGASTLSSHPAVDPPRPATPSCSQPPAKRALSGSAADGPSRARHGPVKQRAAQLSAGCAAPRAVLGAAEDT